MENTSNSLRDYHHMVLPQTFTTYTSNFPYLAAWSPVSVALLHVLLGFFFFFLIDPRGLQKLKDICNLFYLSGNETKNVPLVNLNNAARKPEESCEQEFSLHVCRNTRG